MQELICFIWFCSTGCEFSQGNSGKKQGLQLRKLSYQESFEIFWGLLPSLRAQSLACVFSVKVVINISISFSGSPLINKEKQTAFFRKYNQVSCLLQTEVICKAHAWSSSLAEPVGGEEMSFYSGLLSLLAHVSLGWILVLRRSVKRNVSLYSLQTYM